MCKAHFPDTEEQGLPRGPGGRVVATEGCRAPLDGGPRGVWGVGRGRGQGGPACRAACARAGERARPRRAERCAVATTPNRESVQGMFQGSASGWDTSAD